MTIDEAIAVIHSTAKRIPSSCQLEIIFCDGDIYVELCDSESGDVFFAPMYDATWGQKLADCVEQAEAYHRSKTSGKIIKLPIVRYEEGNNR